MKSKFFTLTFQTLITLYFLFVIWLTSSLVINLMRYYTQSAPLIAISKAEFYVVGTWWVVIAISFVQYIDIHKTKKEQ
jgi:hypothetical protein